MRPWRSAAPIESKKFGGDGAGERCGDGCSLAKRADSSVVATHKKAITSSSTYPHAATRDSTSTSADHLPSSSPSVGRAFTPKCYYCRG